jgi:protein-L-isoaspartate(D-aspartate) O-methyltransferase
MKKSTSQALPTDTTKEELMAVLRTKGIRDERVLKALSSVPREKFVPAIFVRKAYNDVALPIGQDQTISQPYTVAFMTQELNVEPGCKILEIGTGSGYQAAVLATMGAEVVSIERQPELYRRTSPLLASLHLPITCILGDGTLGCAERAPYDRIIVTAGAPDLPQHLLHQLRIGGRLIAPVGGSTQQRMVIVDRLGESEYDERTSKECFSFVPLIGEDGWSDRSGSKQ